MAEGNPMIIDYLKENYCECRLTQLSALRLTSSIDKLLYSKHIIEKIKNESTEELVIPLTIDGKQYNAAIRLASDQLKYLRKESETFSNTVQTWGIGVTGFNQALELGQKLLDQIIKPLQLAAEQEVLKDLWGGSAEDMELFKKAVAGTLTDSSIMKLSNQAKDLGLSMEQQAIFLSMADDAADKYGGTVESSFIKLLNATEGADKGLKELGVQKEQYEKIVKDLTKAHGDEIQHLDAEVQKQIRIHAILQSSGISIEDVKKKTKDSADVIDQWGIAGEEAMVKLGELILPLAKDVTNALIPALKGIYESMDDVISVGTTLGILIAGYIVSAKLAAWQTGGWTIAELASLATIEAKIVALGIATKAQTAYNTAVKANPLMFMATMAAAAGYTIYELTEKINENTESIRKNREEAFKNHPEADKSGFSGRSYIDDKEAEFNKYDTTNDRFGLLFKSQLEGERELTKEVLTREKIEAKIRKLKLEQKDVEIGSKRDKEITSEIEKLEKSLKTDKELHKERLAIEKEMYEKMKYESANYYAWRVTLIDEDVKKFKQAELNDVQIQRFKNLELMKLEEERKEFFKQPDIVPDDSLYSLLKPLDKMADDLANDFLDNELANAREIANIRVEAMQEGFDKQQAALDLWYKEQTETKLYKENSDAKIAIDELYAKRTKEIDDQIKEYKLNNIQEIISNLSSAFNDLYSMAKDSARDEIGTWKDKEEEKLNAEKKSALKHARNEQARERIEEQFRKRKEALDEEVRRKAADKLAFFFKMQQVAAMGETIFSTYRAATAALEPPPIGLGPVWGIPLAVTTVAKGIANAAYIGSQKLPGYRKGGIVIGEEGPEIIENMQDYVQGRAELIRKTILAVRHSIDAMDLRISSRENMGLYTEIKKLNDNFARYADRPIKNNVHIDTRKVVASGLGKMKRSKL